MSSIEHYMIDVETLGLNHDAAIWQVGLLPFMLDQKSAARSPERADLYAFMNPTEVNSLAEVGLVSINNETCFWQGQQKNRRPWFWWAQQCAAIPEDIRAAAAAEVREYPHEAGLHAEANFTIAMLHAWLTSRIAETKRRGAELHFWSKGKDFEMKVLSSAFDSVGLRAPWAYYQFHCVRDFVARPWLLAGLEPPRHPSATHNAMDDCIAQIALMDVSLKLGVIPQ